MPYFMTSAASTGIGALLIRSCDTVTRDPAENVGRYGSDRLDLSPCRFSLDAYYAAPRQANP
jgi:hypothetical protein